MVRVHRRSPVRCVGRMDQLGVCVGKLTEGECVGEMWDCYGARPSTAIAGGEEGEKVVVLHVDGPSECGGRLAVHGVDGR